MKLSYLKKCSIRQLLAFSCLLFYPFNFTISDGILFGKLNPFLLTILGIILLVPDIKVAINKKHLPIYILIIISIISIIFRNETIETTAYNVRQLIILAMYLLLAPVLISTKINSASLVLAITLFSIEHIIGTALPILLPSFYETHILPFICGSRYQCFAKLQYMYGQNAGLTSHYSTNGLYMSIFALVFSGLYIKNRNKKALILTIVSVIALLIIGKRAHLIFTLLAILAGYITSGQNTVRQFLKKHAKVIIITIISIVALALLSSAIPQINTTINRIIESSKKDDISNGRIPLYTLAIEEWNKHPIIGNGWGHYINESHKRFGIDTYGSDYMHTHNDYLELLCDGGLAFCSFYVAILIYLLTKTYKNRQNTSFGYFSFQYMIFYITYGLTGTPISIYTTLAFLVFIIVKTAKEKNEKNRSYNI